MEKFTSYNAVVDFMMERLPAFTRIGAAAMKPNLNNITQLCTRLGNPQNTYKIIHVAGTNGKGTVSHLIAGMLQSQGYKVGLHTSPHYKDIRERFKINGKLSSKQVVIDFINDNRAIIEELNPSYFELTVAMSFSYFAAQNVDYAVIEVGLGGRLDSTNIVNPILSVITNISLDHTEFLGDTIPLIAREKAGIIKQNVPVIIGEKQIETTVVFLDVAENNKAEITFAEDVLAINIVDPNLARTSFDIACKALPSIDGRYTIDIAGPFQQHNLRTAFAAISTLNTLGIQFNAELIRYFFTNFRNQVAYMGRWQLIGKQPAILVDSAHNKGGMDYILTSLNALEYQKLHMVIGFAKDKDRTKILKNLPSKAQYYAAKANIPRGLDADELANELKNGGLQANSYDSVQSALTAAKANADKNDLIFVGGSIFVVAEVV